MISFCGIFCFDEGDDGDDGAAKIAALGEFLKTYYWQPCDPSRKKIATAFRRTILEE